MRLKDQIKLLKLALKKEELYSDVELHYMKKELNNAKHNLKLKRQRKQKCHATTSAPSCNRKIAESQPT